MAETHYLLNNQWDHFLFLVSVGKKKNKKPPEKCSMVQSNIAPFSFLCVPLKNTPIESTLVWPFLPFAIPKDHSIILSTAIVKVATPFTRH
jgi:hypothetical protein